MYLMMNFKTIQQVRGFFFFLNVVVMFVVLDEGGLWTGFFWLVEDLFVISIFGTILITLWLFLSRRYSNFKLQAYLSFFLLVSNIVLVGNIRFFTLFFQIFLTKHKFIVFQYNVSIFLTKDYFLQEKENQFLMSILIKSINYG